MNSKIKDWYKCLSATLGDLVDEYCAKNTIDKDTLLQAVKYCKELGLEIWRNE